MVAPFPISANRGRRDGGDRQDAVAANPARKLAEAARVDEGRSREGIGREGGEVGIDDSGLVGSQDGRDRRTRRQGPHEVTQPRPDGGTHQSIKLIPVPTTMIDQERAKGAEEGQPAVSSELNNARDVRVTAHRGAKHRVTRISEFTRPRPEVADGSGGGGERGAPATGDWRARRVCRCGW